MQSRPILIVSANSDRRGQLASALASAGYRVRTTESDDHALQVAADEDLRLILLAPHLSHTNPTTFCRRLRRVRFIPVLVVGHTADAQERIAALEAGVDDFISQPIPRRELLARIKALLRRVELTRHEQWPPAPPMRLFRFGNLTIDEARHEVLLDDRLLNLRPREYELLRYFARHRGLTLSRDQIFAEVWRESIATSRRTVDVHVRWLRQKIEPDPGNARRIIAIRSVGYRFEG